MARLPISLGSRARASAATRGTTPDNTRRLRRPDPRSPAFRQALIDWQLWVTKGPQALPVKIVITTRYEVGDPQYQAVLHWDTGARIDAKSFTFVPPSGSTKIPYHGEAAATTGEAK